MSKNNLARGLLINLVGNYQTIPVHRLFIKLTGGHVDAIVMAQLIYWQGTKQSDEWFYKTDDELGEECCVSYDQLKRIRKNLEPLGVSYGRKGLPAKMHYHVDLDILEEKLNDFLRPEQVPDFSNNCKTPEQVFSETPEHSLPTENTTETTFTEQPQAAFSDTEGESENLVREEPSSGLPIPVLQKPTPSPKPPSPKTFTPAIRPKTQPKKNPPKESSDDYFESVEQYSEETEIKILKKEFRNLWAGKVKDMGGVFPKTDATLNTKIKRLFDAYPDDTHLFLDWVEWIFENWQMIKEQEKNIFGGLTAPPISNFTSAHYSEKYLTMFKQAGSVQTGNFWTDITSGSKEEKKSGKEKKLPEGMKGFR